MWEVNERQTKTEKMVNTDIWMLTDGDKIQHTDRKNVDEEPGTWGSNNSPRSAESCLKIQLNEITR